jgi:[acyl-carrier-protein] S-malonyltransferase
MVEPKVGLVFPGQGSQFVGMGGDLYRENGIFRDVFHRAQDLLKMDMLGLWTKGPRETLDQTLYTQLAVLVFELAAWEAFREEICLRPLVAAGHSLGEYSAIYASGALGMEAVLSLVRARAQRHEDAVPAGTGAMLAILGLDGGTVEKLCLEATREGEEVDVANLNAPIQVVVSGHARAVERLALAAGRAGAKKTVPLPISVPCHSRLLRTAADLFEKSLRGVSFQAFQIPVIPNCDPAAFYTPESAAGLLKRQIISPVRWQETVERMGAMGVDTIVEIGPRKVLSGLVKNINRNIRLFYVGDVSSLRSAVETLCTPSSPGA